MALETAEGPAWPGGPPLADLDHGDLGPNMIAAATVTWSIALVFVLLRFYTRSRLVNALGFTDWCIALSLLAAGGFCISLLQEIKYGMGKHIWDIDFHNDFSPMMKAWWFSLLFYVLSLSLTKVSICLLYLTIFTFEWARRACYAVLFVVIVTNLWAIATTLTFCIPLKSAWDPTVAPRYCHPQEAWWANAGLVIVTDLMIFCLPIPFLLPLKLPRRQKLVVVGIFTVGFFVCIVSLIRLAILICAKETVDPDFTYTGTTLTYWTLLEVHTAIVVACTMTLKPLIAKFFPGLLVPRRRRRRRTPDYAGGVFASKDDGSAASSGPPPTIGSRPSRPQGGGQQQHQQQQQRQQQQQPGAEEIMLGDAESGIFSPAPHVCGVSHGFGGEDGEEGDGGGVVRGVGLESVPASEGCASRTDEIEKGCIRPGSSGREDAASERTEDLGTVVTARSMG